MGTFFFFLTIFVIPGFPSGALVGRWGMLALCAATLLFKTELPKSAWAVLAWLAVMAWYGPVWYEAINLYIHAAFFVVLYCYAQKLPDLRRIAIGMALGITVNSAVVLGQDFLGWGGIPQITPGSGLYFNRNIASETAAMALALAAGYRLWWLIPGILPTLALGSRIPVVALGCAGAVALYRYSKIAAVLAVVLPVLLCISWLQTHTGAGLADTSFDRNDAIVLAGVLDTLKQRMGTWYDGAHGFTVLGQGLGSWMVNFPLYQVHSNTLELRWENAHNDTVQLVFELGAAGALVVAIFLVRLMASERRPEFYALLVFFVEGCFGFPLYQPVTGALAVVSAGYLFGRGVPLRQSVVRLGLRIRHGYENARGAIHRPGVGALPVEPGPPLGAGLPYHHQSRSQPYQSDRGSVTL